MRKTLIAVLAALMTLAVCSCADPESHETLHDDPSVSVESENEALADAETRGADGVGENASFGAWGDSEADAPRTGGDTGTDDDSSSGIESEDDLSVDGDDMIADDSTPNGEETTQRSEISGTTSGATSRSGGVRSGSSTTRASSSTTRASSSTTRAQSSTGSADTSSRPASTTKASDTTAQGGTTAVADPEPEPAVPAEPAPSYPLKSSAATPAEANSHDVPKSSIFEGAGPLGSGNIYVGLHGFFFFGECVDYLRGDNPIPNGNIARFARIMNERDAWAKQNGIDLIFVIAPNKATVYNDYVPSTVVQSPYTRTDQIVDYLAANSTVRVVDLRPTLKNARASYGDDLYYHYDTHWNQNGGFAAYLEIMKAVREKNPSAVSYGYNAFNVNWYETYMKDMAWYLGWYDDYYDSGPVYSLKEGPAATLAAKSKSGSPTGQYRLAYRWPDGYRDDLTYLYYKSKNTQASSVYVYQDSFGIALMPFLKESFAEANFEWSHRLSKQDILEMGVDTVIIEVAEKELDDFIKLRAFY